MNSLKNKIEFYEKKRIIRALEECNWVKSRAAKMLGLTDRVIGYKIKQYGIETTEVAKVKRE